LGLCDLAPNFSADWSATVADDQFAADQATGALEAAV
jgi:hypothetical protein